MSPTEYMKKRMNVDIIGDLSNVLIIIITFFISLFLMFLPGIQSPIFDILFFLIWFFCFGALILQDITTVEANKDRVIIHRYFFGPIEVKKKDIELVKVKNNIGGIYRILFNLFMLAALAYISFNEYSNISQNLIDGRPVESMVLSVLSNSIVLIFVLILFLNAEKRLRCPSFLEVITKKGKFRFYSHDTEDFRMIANTEMQEKPS